MRLKTKQVATWVPMEDTDSNKCRFLINPLTPKEINTMLDKATETTWEKGQRFENLNGVKYRTNKLKKAILDWEGVEDEDGNPLECNAQNIELIYLNNPNFIDALLDKVEALYQVSILKDEEDSKNLNSGLNGTVLPE